MFFLNMRGIKSGSLLDQSFRFSIALKGLHALLEIILGIAVLMVSPQAIHRFVLPLLHSHLLEDPDDFVTIHLLRAVQHFADGGQAFASFYLLSHGLVKFALVLALFRNKLWAYPTMIVMLVVFVFYQVYRFALTHSLAMVLLTIFDIVVIVLTWLEYNKQKSDYAANGADSCKAKC
jgi:uncharacterized membrane protein